MKDHPKTGLTREQAKQAMSDRAKVQGGAGTGYIVELSGDSAIVAWDSGERSPTPIGELSLAPAGEHPGRHPSTVPINPFQYALALIDERVRAAGNPGPIGSGVFLLLENIAAQLGVPRSGFTQPPEGPRGQGGEADYALASPPPTAASKK